MLCRLIFLLLLGVISVVVAGRCIGAVAQWSLNAFRAEAWHEWFMPVEAVIVLAFRTKYLIALALLVSVSIGCLMTIFSRWIGLWRRRRDALKEYGMPAELPCVCLSDSPLDAHGKDLLHRESTEELLAYYMLRCLSRTQSGRIALFGEWGSGKTSVLNRAIVRIDRYESVPVVVRFDAWQCSSRKDIVFALYSNAAKQCYREGKYRVAAAFMSLAITSTPFLKIKQEDIAAFFVAAISWVFHAVIDAGSVMKKVCGDGRIHTLIVIDDVDRLPYKQVRELLYAVASTGDVPGVNYVVAADKQYLIDAFDAEAKGHGEKYWEKLFPVAVHLPGIPTSELLEFFLERVKTICDALKIKYRSQEVTSLPFVLKHLTNYRSVIRVSNEVAVQLSRMKVAASGLRPFHLGDLLELSALHLFEPVVYENLYRFKFPLLAVTYKGLPPQTFTRHELLAMLCPHLSDEIRIDDVMRFLQDHLAYIKRGDEDAYVYSAIDKVVDADLRLCSRKCFANYFDAKVGEMALFAKYKEEFELALETDEKTVFDYLIELESKHFLLTFLSDYEYTAHMMSEDAAWRLVRALIQLSDRDLECTESRGLSISNADTPYILASRLLLDCIERYPSCRVERVLDECIKRHSLNMTNTLLIMGAPDADGFGGVSWHLSKVQHRRALLFWMQEMERRVVGQRLGVFSLPNGKDLYESWGCRAFDIANDAEECDANFLVRGQRFLDIQNELVKTADGAMRILEDTQGWLDSAFCPKFFRPIGFDRLQARIGMRGIENLLGTLKTGPDSSSLPMRAIVLVLEDYLNDLSHPKGMKEQAALVKTKLVA